MNGPESSAVRVERPAMGMSHDDFFRVLPRVLEGLAWRREGLAIHAEWPQGARLVASVSPQRQRRIASLCLPMVDIELVFNNLDAAELAAFLQRFDTAFHKGGG